VCCRYRDYGRIHSVGACDHDFMMLVLEVDKEPKRLIYILLSGRDFKEFYNNVSFELILMTVCVFFIIFIILFIIT
jgi:hypothetical protein